MANITSIDQLDLNKKYSYADYLTWQFSEYVELLRGKIVRMSPAPTRKHQRVGGKIFNSIMNYLEDKKCEVYSAPFDVRLLDHKKSANKNKDIYTVVQPDICVICDLSKLDDKGCIGAPDLIVEVLSPSTMEKDITEKYELYEQSGVREYWIVSPNDETVVVFDLNSEGKYSFRKIYTHSEKIKVKVLDGCEVDLKKVFEEGK